MDHQSDHILVIKLGALGDFIQALGPMQAIRAHHPNAHVTLLTTKPFAKLAEASGYFDHVQIDEKPKLLDIGKWMSLRSWINSQKFSRVYDLQNNDRTNLYYKLLSPKPEWVGTAKGASHCNTSPDRTAGHAFDGHAQTLGLAGINHVNIDNLNWINTNIDTKKLKITSPYVLLVPGCAPDRPEKRWPGEKFARLADIIHKMGYQPVLIGTDSEKDVNAAIAKNCPNALDLTGKTKLLDIVVLGRNASACVGNDTGPMHMIAPTGCPCVVLFSGHSDPLKHYPKGPDVQTIQRDNIADIRVEDATQALKLTEQVQKNKQTGTIH